MGVSTVLFSSKYLCLSLAIAGSLAIGVVIAEEAWICKQEPQHAEQSADSKEPAVEETVFCSFDHFTLVCCGNDNPVGRHPSEANKGERPLDEPAVHSPAP